MNIRIFPRHSTGVFPRTDGCFAADAGEDTSALQEVLHGMKAEIRAVVPDRIEVDIGVTAEDLPRIGLSPAQAQDLIRHLVIDAVDAMPETGILSIMLEPTIPRADYLPPLSELAPGHWVMLSVSELNSRPPRGSLAAELAPHHSLLDKGRALGLSAAYEAVEHAGGSFTVARREKETSVHIYFPAVERAVLTQG